MKKVLCLLLVLLTIFGLTACSGDNGTETTKVETEKVTIFRGDYYDLFSDDIKEALANSSTTLEENEILLLGSELGKYSFYGYDGTTITLPDRGPYILEIVGSWCTYCQSLTKEILDNNIQKEIPVYQYFTQGSVSDVESFYEAIGKEVPDDITIILSSSDLEKLLDEKEFYSVPMSILVNAEGKVALTHLGYTDATNFRKFIETGSTYKLYDTMVNGMKLTDFFARQAKIKKYLSEVTEIEIPVDYLNN